MIKYIDAHSHIDYITHNIQNDVVGTVCCTTDESQWQRLINLMNQDKKIYGAFGVHPWSVDKLKNVFELRLENVLKTNRNFMVGEIGLDKYKPNMEHQIDVFIKQFEIAIKLKRSVFLHCVGAWDKILQILKRYKKCELPIIVAHDFNGNEKILQTLLNNYNFMFSYHRIDKHNEICRIEQTPLDCILVETDGKSNILLSNVVDKIAQIKQNSNMPEIIYNNTKKVLKNG